MVSRSLHWVTWGLTHSEPQDVSRQDGDTDACLPELHVPGPQEGSLIGSHCCHYSQGEGDGIHALAMGFGRKSPIILVGAG